jgi:hypothetical protein
MIFSANRIHPRVKPEGKLRRDMRWKILRAADQRFNAADLLPPPWSLKLTHVVLRTQNSFLS